MHFNQEEIRLLIIEKLAGTIEPADDLILLRLIEEEPGAKQMWLAMQNEMQEAERAGFDLNVNEDQKWAELDPLLTRREPSKIRVMVKRIIAAASFIAIIVMGYRWLQSGKKPSGKELVKKESTNKKRMPTLELPNHKLIELGDENRKINIEGAVLELNHHVLSYKLKANNNQDWILHIPAGSDYKIKLSDGSEVWMNSASQLKFPANFTAGTRDVSIEGEAFFKVAKNKERPFVVHTAATDVLVTGTAFNVNTYDAGKIQTALVEGSVTLRDQQAKELELKPGYEADFIKQQGFSTHRFDSLDVLSWMKGVYYFRNTPLHELSAVVRRWYDVDTDFATAELRKKTFSGELRKHQPLQSFLENLSLSGNVKGELVNGKILFR